jgi:hypothetical protein
MRSPTWGNNLLPACLASIFLAKCALKFEPLTRTSIFCLVFRYGCIQPEAARLDARHFLKLLYFPKPDYPQTKQACCRGLPPSMHTVRTREGLVFARTSDLAFCVSKNGEQDIWRCATALPATGGQAIRYEFARVVKLAVF